VEERRRFGAGRVERANSSELRRQAATAVKYSEGIGGR
jgi:hypothetical protein